MKPENFRKLTPAEEAEFRQWARSYYKPGEPIPEVWHPATRAEAELMNLERNRERGASSAPLSRCECDRVPVLCGCGWGVLSLPSCEVPERCPVCGFGFWETFGEPEPCTTWKDSLQEHERQHDAEVSS
jgi:hypothetical protein